jgi:PHD/YefM family antitoxin component YafN of YafNO toxin-antitoxin module
MQRVNGMTQMSVEDIADDCENKMESLIEQGETIAITEDGMPKAIVIPIHEYNDMMNQLALVKDDK